MSLGRHLFGLLVLTAFFFPISVHGQRVIRVDASAGAGGDGTSWDQAYQHLQDALNAASEGDEIWVAEGKYRPDQGAGIPDGKRDTSFHLKSGVALYGGFGGTETRRAARDADPATNGTVLSGDLAGDDDSDFPSSENRSDNVAQVVVADRTVAATTVLDGFTISGGGQGTQFLGTATSGRTGTKNHVSRGNGGGIYNEGDARFANLILEHHVTFQGAALYNAEGSAPTLQDVVVRKNSADLSIVENRNSAATFRQVTIQNNEPEYGYTVENISSGEVKFVNAAFVGNQGGNPVSSDESGGGAVYNDRSDVTFVNAKFIGNFGSDEGGGMANAESDPTIINAVFEGNLSLGGGGGLYNVDNSSPTLVNVLFWKNESGDSEAGYDGYGGGVYSCSDCTPSLVNVTFVGNQAKGDESEGGYGGAMYTKSGSRPVVRNSIFWNNRADEKGNEIFNAGDAVTDVDTSLVEGGYGSGDPNLIRTDAPKFVDPSTGNFNLTDGSPALDVGENARLPPDTLDLDEDGNTSETLPVDLGGTPRLNDNNPDAESSARVDLGAYEAPPDVKIPVELASFRATVDQKSALLHWQTASETNNAGFRVEHRAPASSDWKRIGFVEGGGTTDQPQQYQFNTSKLSVGEHTFRLRQVDLDGTETVHDSVQIEVGRPDGLVLKQPVPNPVQQTATIRFAAGRQTPVRVALYDVLGRRVRTLHDGRISNGEFETVRLDAQSLSSGSYFIRMSGSSGRDRVRPIKVVR